MPLVLLIPRCILVPLISRSSRPEPRSQRHLCDADAAITTTMWRWCRYRRRGRVVGGADAAGETWVYAADGVRVYAADGAQAGSTWRGCGFLEWALVV